MTRKKQYSEITAELKDIIKFLDTLNEKIREARRNRGMSELAKRVAGMIKVQHSLPHAPRLSDEDRKIPLESVRCEEFRMENGAELDRPLIHYGPYANELTRSRNLIALAIGSDIFFRNGAYRPETEEGRALLAHELTHVAQHKNRPLADNRTKDELEAEAEAAERTEQLPAEPLVVLRAGGRQCRMRRSDAVRLDAYTEREVKDWIEHEKDMMPDKEYARLLQAYRLYLDGREQGRRPWTEERQG